MFILYNYKNYYISYECPTKPQNSSINGTIIEAEGVKWFIYHDLYETSTNKNHKALLVLKGRNNKLRVLAKNEAYEKAWNISKYIRNENFYCDFYVNFTYNDGLGVGQARLVDDEILAHSYPNLQWPAPDPNWVSVIFLAATLSAAIYSIVTGYQNIDYLYEIWLISKDYISESAFIEKLNIVLRELYYKDYIGLNQAKYIWNFIYTKLFESNTVNATTIVTK